MALTSQTVGLSEEAAVSRSHHFQPGDFVRLRSVLLDNTSATGRPLDYGQVRDEREPGKVSVLWSQAARCGHDERPEDPADLVTVTKAEFDAFCAGFTTGYAAAYQDDES